MAAIDVQLSTETRLTATMQYLGPATQIITAKGSAGTACLVDSLLLSKQKQTAVKCRTHKVPSTVPNWLQFISSFPLFPIQRDPFIATNSVYSPTQYLTNIFQQYLGTPWEATHRTVTLKPLTYPSPEDSHVQHRVDSQPNFF